MTSGDPKYAPNPDRAIYVQGVIDQALLYRLTPQIISLQNQGDEPLTIYIDSPGGSVSHMESLLHLLRFRQNSDDPTYFITVVTAQAASAAADMLAAGNYAHAYRDSKILYHGVRTPGDRVLTVEETLQLAQRLKAGNKGYAMELARQAEFRAIFRFISLRDKFADVRAETPDDDLSELQCFVSLIARELSISGLDVLEKALKRHRRYKDLLEHIAAHCKIPAAYKSRSLAEAAQIRAILSFELKQNKPDKDWSFLNDGMNRLSDDFFLFHEYIGIFRSNRFKKLCGIFSDFLLTPEQQQEIENTPEEEKLNKITSYARPTLEPVWSFFVALCHGLQEGENQLTGLDAFWLGLIDEVVGVPNLPTFRLWIEHAKQRAEDEQEKVEVEEEAVAVLTEGAAAD